MFFAVVCPFPIFWALHGEVFFALASRVFDMSCSIQDGQFKEQAMALPPPAARKPCDLEKCLTRNKGNKSFWPSGTFVLVIVFKSHFS